jgi:nucleotide-binding universal stress UspA family protein
MQSLEALPRQASRSFGLRFRPFPLLFVGRAPEYRTQMNEPPYRSIAVAVTFSPRFHQVLAEANRVRERFGSRLSMIYVGKRDAATVEKFADAITKLNLPQDSAVHYEEGDPANGILAGARKLSAELLIAGALEKKAIHRQFLGDVARRLVREATCSVMLFTQPQLEPKPLRHIVFMAEYSDHAQRALRRALHLAERENCERLYVIRNYTSFDKARAARRPKSGKGTARTLEEEEIALQEFILAAGNTAVPIEARCIRGNTGFAASNFVQAVEANLLVVPLETKPEPKPKLSRRIAWVNDVIPCNLWIVR